MAKKTTPPVDDGFPKCCLCRNGTYATVAFKMFPEDEKEQTYCDLCGKAMASVIKDSYQKRVAEVKRLPEPPPKVEVKPLPPPPPPKVEVAPVPPSKPKVEVKPPPPRPVRVMDAAKEAEEEPCDLLSLLGWKR